MIREINTGSDQSILDSSMTKGLGVLTFRHPIGTFSITPASSILFRAIIDHQDLLHGVGIDWGTGVGCQAILAAKIPAVDLVYGLEISQENITTAIENANENAVEGKVRFILSDSYAPFLQSDQQQLQTRKGRVDFILSNPPSSDWDDGFGFRRIVLSGAKEFLKKGGIVLLNASFQYGMERIHALVTETGGFIHRGVIATTQCVPFDLSRPDLLDCLKTYCKEEINGGMDYTFIEDSAQPDRYLNARTALDRYETHGTSPYTMWQTHLFQWNK